METTINPRQSRGREIARTIELKRENGFWFVPSQSKATKYRVDFKRKVCSCPDYEFRRQKCKHIFAVEFRCEWALLDELSKKEATEQKAKTIQPRKTYRFLPFGGTRYE